MTPSTRIAEMVGDYATRFHAFNLGWRNMQFCRWYFADYRELKVNTIQRKIEILDDQMHRLTLKKTILNCKTMYYIDLNPYPRP